MQLKSDNIYINEMLINNKNNINEQKKEIY